MAHGRSAAADKGDVLGSGFYYEQMPVGFRFQTMGRTITETDLVAFINLTWFIEDLFVNVQDASHKTLKGRVVPAMMLYCFAEGLIHPSMQFTGQAFLGADIDVKAPTVVGDTIRVECEVIEARLASKGHRGLVRTLNHIVNQRGEVVIAYRPLRLVSRRP
jgi:acyl dehydratase